MFRTLFRNLVRRLVQQRKRTLAEASPWSFGQLEDRLLLAADAGVAVEQAGVYAEQGYFAADSWPRSEGQIDTQAEASTTNAADQPASDPVSQVKPIVFLDSRVSYSDQLASDARDRAEVIVIDSNQSAIEVITKSLQQRSNLPAIHLVGHGQAGAMQLGRDGLTRAMVEAYRMELQTWRSAMARGGDILMYGCHTGAGSEGTQFLEGFAGVTQLDVAASTNATGMDGLNADWNLENQVGTIESQVVFSQQLQQAYVATLPITIRAAGQTGDESMSLQVDGVTVQTWNNVGGNFNSGVYQSFTYDGDGISADRIRVTFNNDLTGPGGYDRNLRVESIRTDSLTIRTIEPQVFASGAWDPVNNRPTSGFLQTERLFVNGYFQFAEPNSVGSSITIAAAGQTGQEQMQLLVDNQIVATWSGIGGNAAQDQYQSFTYNASRTVTADQIRVAFTNDFFSVNTDRNLYVNSVTIDGQVYRTDAPTVLSTATWSSSTNDVRPGFYQSNALHANGYVAFSTNTTNQGSQIIIRASGSEGGEQMQLKIAGQTVRSWVVDRGAEDNQFQWYGYRAASNANADQLQIAFVGDSYVAGVFDANLRVDRVSINNIIFETESPSVLSTGTWQDGFQPRFASSEYLNTDGFFQYSQGGSNPGALSLASSRTTVDENAGQATVVVQRTGGSNGSMLVDYTLVAGTASPVLDYSAPASGVLIFLPGQTSASIPILIIDDSLFEGNETFNVTIDNLRGTGTLAAPRTATVLINDNDTVLPTFSSFTSTQSLQLNGNAALDAGTLRLTSAANNLRGSAFFTTPLPVTSTTSFQTNFGFRLDGGQGIAGADGFAFLLQNATAGASALGSGAGGAMGYNGISNSVIIEFDTFQNPGEISNNHVSILVGGSSVPLTTRNVSFDFNSGSNLRAWIDYNGDARELAVYVSNGTTKPTAAIATAALDLAAIVGNRAFMGFTAATGGANNNHRILDWNVVLTPPVIVPPPPGTSLVNEVVSSGYVRPTAIEFSPDGRNMYVAQQSGEVYVVRDGARQTTPFIDISAQVNGTRDRGLLDIAVHPDFANNPYVYLLYTYDPPEVFQNTSNALAGPDRNGNRAGRLIRVTANAATNFTTAVAGSEFILLGRNSTWANFNAFVNSTNNFTEPPAGIVNGVNIQDFIASDSESHTVGSLEFGIDGALFVSIGDGTSYNQVDPRTIRVQDIDNLSGKILRIDPITGQGLSSNPFFNGDANANRSKVYQLGLRNPFRISVDPVTGELFVGDVGWTQWEEINSAGPGANFGWPYFEGGNGTSLRTGGYQNLAAAQTFYASGQPVQAPLLGLNHAATGINAIVAGPVYRGTTYPGQYVGDLFYNDLGQGIVSNISFNPDGSIASTQTFATGAQAVVQIVQGVDGNMYYVDLDDGRIGRWLFV